MDAVRFTETLAGRLGDPALPVDEAARRGQDSRFVLVVVSPDVARLVADPDHRSPAFGCLLAPWLSEEPLRVERGQLDLFVDLPGARPAVEMRYRLELVHADGRHLVLTGIKSLRRRFWLWTFPWDATTLRCELREGERLLAHGWLRQGLVGVLAQGATFRATSLRALLGFFRYYLGTVLRVYLG